MMDFEIIAHAPRVFLISQPKINWDEMNAYLDYRGTTWNRVDSDDNDPELVFESGGRVCYGSYPNAVGRTTAEYINTQIVGREHGSVLEQGWFTFMVADLPRSVQLELVRHGDGTSFSFESTRFTDNNMRFIVPPHFRDDEEECREFEHDMMQAVNKYSTRLEAQTARYKALYPDDKTLARKRAKEAARCVLPMSQGSDGEVGMNARALRWIIHSRTDEHADLSIREFGYALYESTSKVLKGVFADAHVIPATEGTPTVRFDHPKV